MLISPDLPIVIVGSGPVGDCVVKELLRRAPDAPTVVFNNEPWEPYDRINLVGVLTGQLTWADLDLHKACPLPAGSHVTVHHDLIVAIDRDARTVTDQHGRRHPYSILVLATGSQANRPNMPGIHLQGIYTLRHRGDVEQLAARHKESRRIAVVGGGVLGLEIARGLHSDRTKVCIFQDGRLMARQVDEKASAMVLDHVRELGIEAVLDRPKEILGEDAVTGIRTYSEEIVECDTVVLAIGVQPIVDLALRAGLRVGRGIKVNDRMQTSDPFIYAVGECMEHRGGVYGLVGPGFEQATVAVQNILGGKAAYQGTVMLTRLKRVDLPVLNVSRLEVNPPAYEEVTYERAHDRIYRKMLLHRGRVMGAMAIGEWPDIWRVQEATRRKRWLWPWQRRRFLTTGSPWPERSTPSVRAWPAQAAVCICKGITCGTLSQAVQMGHVTVEALQEHTGAGTGCGSCKPLLAQFVGQEAAAEPVAGEKMLIGACCAALFLVLAISLLSPIAPVDSVQGRWHPEVLWLDGFWKQVSGYSLLALSLVALTLSLHKRWQRFSFASFGRWRVLHGLVGVLTLGLLFVHTGLHLGRSPLNILLMTCFLGLNLFGAIAGGMAVAEGRSLSPTIRNWRARWVWYHTLLFWLVPILLIFHILAVYYF